MFRGLLSYVSWGSPAYLCKKRAILSGWLFWYVVSSPEGERLQFRSGSYESLSGFVTFKLSEVLDEASCEVFSFLFPSSGVSVSVARVEDFRIYARQFSRNDEVEVRDNLSRSFVDRTVEDSVDDTASVADGDTLACTVPAGVDQVSLGANFFHSLHEFLSVFCRVKRQERSAETSGESWSRLSDAALCSCQFSGKSGEEVVFCLLSVEDGNRRKNSESVSGEEDHLMSVRAFGNRLHDVLDVVDRVGNAGVLSHALVSEVDFAVSVHSDVFKKSVALDSVVDVRLAFLVEVDDLCVAAALVVEHAFVVPSVFVVADEETFRVGGKSSLACPGETEEDS